ncbi:hypothetical protein [Streptomyces spinosirectus]
MSRTAWHGTVDQENGQPEGIVPHAARFDGGAPGQAGITGEPGSTFSPMRRRFVASGVSAVG